MVGDEAVPSLPLPSHCSHVPSCTNWLSVCPELCFEAGQEISFHHPLETEECKAGVSLCLLPLFVQFEEEAPTMSP